MTAPSIRFCGASHDHGVHIYIHTPPGQPFTCISQCPGAFNCDVDTDTKYVCARCGSSQIITEGTTL